jgi:hypothetical protein
MQISDEQVRIVQTSMVVSYPAYICCNMIVNREAPRSPAVPHRASLFPRADLSARLGIMGARLEAEAWQSQRAREHPSSAPRPLLVCSDPLVVPSMTCWLEQSYSACVGRASLDHSLSQNWES